MSIDAHIARDRDAVRRCQTHDRRAQISSLARRFAAAGKEAGCLQFHVMRALRLQAIGSCLRFKWASF